MLNMPLLTERCVYSFGDHQRGKLTLRNVFYFMHDFYHDQCYLYSSWQLFSNASCFNEGIRLAISVGIPVSQVELAAQSTILKQVSDHLKLTAHTVHKACLTCFRPGHVSTRDTRTSKPIKDKICYPYLSCRIS